MAYTSYAKHSSMEIPRILIAVNSETIVSELREHFQVNHFDLEIVHLKTLDLLLNDGPKPGPDVVITESPSLQFPLENVIQYSQALNSDCLIYVLFDTLEEEAIASAIKLGATSFGLKSNLSRLAAQIQNRQENRSPQIEPGDENHPLKPQQILNAFLTESTDSIWAKSKSGKYLLINPAGANFLRKPIDQIIGKTDYDLFPPDTADKIVKSDREVMLTGVTQTVEDLLVTPDGEKHTFLAVKGIWRNEREEVQGVIGTVRDISLRKQTEETLKQSEQRFRLLVEGVKDHAIYMLDTKGLISSWNTGAERLQGFQSHEILGQHFSCFYVPEDSPEQAPAVSPENILHLTTENGYCEHECWQIRKDGSRYWANVIYTPIYNEQKTLLYFSKVVRDMTEQRKAEEELRFYAAKLEQSNDDLEHFAVIASHDLQAPLRKIRLFSEMLQQYTGEEGQDIAQRLQKAAEKMQQFISDLLELSRINRKGKPFQQVDLNQVLSRVLDDLELIIKESGASITQDGLTAALGESIGKVYGDPFQLEQLFLNILSNSLKFRKPATSPHINIKGQLLPNGHYQMMIQDNGIGFKEEYLEKIFRPFERLHGPVQFPGTGMGLAICKKIIERHGGQIMARSQEGEGATFTILLPTQPSLEYALRTAKNR